MWQIIVKINGELKTVFVNGATMTQARNNFFNSDFYKNVIGFNNYEFITINEPIDKR